MNNAITKFDIARHNTNLFVDDKEIKQATVIADFSHKPAGTIPIIMNIGVAILEFELQQAGVQYNNLIEFVKEDIDKHKEVALRAYIAILEAVLHPKRRKFFGLFQVHECIPAKWVWTHVEDVSIIEETLVISGFCQKKVAT